MSNATVELAKYNLQLNRKAYKTYTDLIEITKTSIKDFRGTELSKIAYINIATLTDILDNLKIEADEYKEIILKDEEGEK